MSYVIFISCWEAPLVPELYAIQGKKKKQRGKVSKGGEWRTWGSRRRARGEEEEEEESRQREGGEWGNTRKEIDQLRGGRKGEQRKGGIKDRQEVTILIHWDPWRLPPMSLSEHRERAGPLVELDHGTHNRGDVGAEVGTATNRADDLKQGILYTEHVQP